MTSKPETTRTSETTDHGTIEEPPNSTVDDWLGQRVDRDEERAERLLEEEGGDEQAAAERWEAGAEKHRPEDVPTEERP